MKTVIDKDGVKGLFGRGLKTRILTNGLQGLMFSVLWRGFEDYFSQSKKNWDPFIVSNYKLNKN